MDLTQFWKENPKAAIAFSGGVDSAYLLYSAIQAGASVKAYYAKTAFQPRFELDDAKKLAGLLRTEMEILSIDILSSQDVKQNPENRCYYCKKMLFSAILAAAAKDGFSLVLDGTNASDEASDRPGMGALRELSVRSPLQECGLTKPEIRRLSRDAGLFTHDKPAYACLATRIPAGEPITPEKLARTEEAENYLTELGLRDFRVRTWGDTARIQVRQSDLEPVMKHREAILAFLKKRYTGIVLDLEVRP